MRQAALFLVAFLASDAARAVEFRPAHVAELGAYVVSALASSEPTTFWVPIGAPEPGPGYDAVFCPRNFPANFKPFIRLQAVPCREVSGTRTDVAFEIARRDGMAFSINSNAADRLLRRFCRALGRTKPNPRPLGFGGRTPVDVVHRIPGACI